MPAPEQSPEDLIDETVSQLNESLKACHKVVSDYKAALLKKPSSDTKPPKRD